MKNFDLSIGDLLVSVYNPYGYNVYTVRIITKISHEFNTASYLYLNEKQHNRILTIGLEQIEYHIAQKTYKHIKIKH